MTTTSHSDLVARLDELESRLAFQDDLIENLNEVITRQDRDLSRMSLQLKDLAVRLGEVADATSGAGGQSDFEVPPHY